MVSRLTRRLLLAAALTLGVLVALPAGASGATVTVGRQALTGFNQYFHCASGAGSSCDNSFSQTALTAPGDRAVVPGDGTIVAWRVVGACIKSGGPFCGHWLRVLRPDGLFNYKFVAGSDAVVNSSNCDRCPPLDGTKIDVSPGIPVEAGEYIAISEQAVGDTDARVMVASATGATYNVFSGPVANGATVAPILGSGWELMFNADVVLDPPVVSSVSPPSGLSTGGRRVAITGDHLATVSGVQFGGVSARDIRVVSNTEVTAVTRAHPVGTVYPTVTTSFGDTSAPSSGANFTFVAPPTTTGRVRSAYVTNYGSDDVSQYAVGKGGRLTPLALQPVVATDQRPFGIGLTPNGRNAYVADDNNRVSQYDVAAGGWLVPKTPPAVPAAPFPTGIAVSPSGHSVYVTNYSGGGVSQFDVGRGGLLAPKHPATVASGKVPTGIAVSPNGRHVYVANRGSDSVSEYDVGTGERLTPKATIGAGKQPSNVVIAPNGGSLYVTNYYSYALPGQPTNSVSQYDVRADGRLVRKAPAMVASGVGTTGLAITPGGGSLYVTDFADGDVAQFDVGAGGRLAPKTPPRVPTGPEPGGIAVSPAGRSVYIARYNDLAQFAIGRAGRLVPDATPPTVATGTYPTDVVVTPNQGPIAAFRATVARAGLATAFDASASRDPDGRVARYDWKFGDGSRRLNGGPKPTHRYAKAGKYEVTLTVTDGGGCSTRLVFTGQTALCNGRSAARTTHTLTVPAH